jgi:hypothetical protein
VLCPSKPTHLLIAVTAAFASVQDRDAAAAVAAHACAKSPRLEKLYTNGTYGGKCVHDIEQTHQIRVEVVRRQVTARWERCMIPRRHLRQTRLSMQGSRSCLCAGSSNDPRMGRALAPGNDASRPQTRCLGAFGSWPRRAYYSTGSLIRVDFVYNLLVLKQQAHGGRAMRGNSYDFHHVVPKLPNSSK